MSNDTGDHARTAGAMEQPAEWQLQQWAAALHQRGLTGFAIPLLDLLKLWGFVGGQLLWMLSPFLGNDATTVATALEQPETLQRLQDQLASLALAEEESQA